MLKAVLIKIFLLSFSMVMLVSFQAQAAKYVKGNSHFSSVEGDSLVFIKAQLLSKARINIIDQELKKMGHDHLLFWQNYNEKFDQYFEPILDKLQKKMGMDAEDLSQVKEKTKKSYFKRLRYKKLKLKARFGRLDKVIKSFAVEKLSRSSQFPNSRYMRVKALVNRKKLNKIYFKFIRTQENRFFRNVFVTIDFNLNGVTWTDFGVEVENDIRNVVGEHWKRWLVDNLKNIVGDVVLSDNDEKLKLAQRFRLPIQEISPVQNVTEDGKMQEGMALLEDRAPGGLWLKLNVNIKADEKDSLLQIRNCIFSGDFVLIDMSNNRLLSHHDFVSQNLNIFNSSLSTELSSQVAGVIYRLPLDKFVKFPKILSSISNNKRSTTLTIKNAGSMKEIYAFSKLIQEKGVRFDSNFKVNFFSTIKTKGTLNYRGEVNKLSELLLSLDKAPLGKQAFLKISDKESPFNFEVIYNGSSK